MKYAGKITFGWARPFVSVPVYYVDTVSGSFNDISKPVGTYNHGAQWPLAILKPGAIHLSTTAKDVLAHEAQHAFDVTGFGYLWKKLHLSKLKRRVWLETRGEVATIRVNSSRTNMAIKRIAFLGDMTLDTAGKVIRRGLKKQPTLKFTFRKVAS